MDELLDAIFDLVGLISSEKVNAVAARIRATEASKAAALLTMLGTPVARAVVEQLVAAWTKTKVTSDELASMLEACSHTYNKTVLQQTIELVWTGPTTPFVSARRTEQALLEVINAAQQSLFITSIVKALNTASDRGVRISMLLELSQDHGGSITFDAIGKMRGLLPSAHLYAWREKASLFSDGSFHAKVAVSDGNICFITSANLTGHAMEKNMEAGVLLSGGQIPRQFINHLESLTYEFNSTNLKFFRNQTKPNQLNSTQLNSTQLLLSTDLDCCTNMFQLFKC